jgi:hypothetical protein
MFNIAIIFSDFLHITDKLCWLLVQAEEFVSMKLSGVQLSEDKSAL